LELVDQREAASGVMLRLLERIESDWLAAVDPGESTDRLLQQIGRTPLPPYIIKARGENEVVTDEQDRRWYQTVYADLARRQSVAAPTAGLHFTPMLLDVLDKAGIQRAEVVLHVGPGTFRPITAAAVQEHRMHSERFWIPSETLALLHNAQVARSHEDSNAPRVVAVGTTSTRALESLPRDLSTLAGVGQPLDGSTDLLIAPPYRFKHVDGLLTNFHLPRSTLLALVAALVGLDRLKSIYAEAVRQGYRFYSYGDAMLILP
jgi:S-adenosylmethionine:tRNA ribosyltransferase-isomerase